MSFAVHKLEKFSSNHGKVHFEGLLYFLIYIRDNKTLDLNYYDDMKDETLSEMLRKASIKTDNQLMAFSKFIWQDFTETGRITGAYIMFYQSGLIDNGTHVPGPVYKSGSESEYNAACTEEMDLTIFRMLVHDF